MLRGAKSLADKIDNGTILLNVTEDDLKKLSPVLQENGLYAPNVKLSVYKNRRGALCQCFLWMVADKGTCRFVTEFVTDWWYNPIEVAPLKIEMK